jgi:hypothetical protein
MFVRVLVPAGRAQDMDAEQFLKSKDRPILANNFYTCHILAAADPEVVDA